MRWNFVSKVAWKELISTFRDRRTLMSTILLPLILIPVLQIALPYFIGSTIGIERNKKQNVGVVGLQRAPKSLVAALEVDAPGIKGVQLQEVSNALRSVQDGIVDAAIILPPALPSVAGGPSVPIQVYFKQSSQKANLLYSKISNAIEAYSKVLVTKKLTEFKLPTETLQPVFSEPINADTKAERASGILAFIIPLFIIQWILAGGQATAIDATAGEKERGTLEALLVTPISRFEVMIGKLIATVTFSVLATMFSILGLLISNVLSTSILPSVLGGMASGPSSSGTESANVFRGNLEIGTDGFAGLLVVCLSLAVLVSTLLLTICIFARSFKEAQTYLAPLSIVLIVPTIFLQFADFITRSTSLYALPLVGSMVSLFDIIKGVTDWSHILIAISANLVVSAIAIGVALRNFSREQVLFRN